MSDRVFIDTNVLVYADDASASKRQRTARKVIAELMAAQRAVFSTQVLAEFFVTATRKLGLSAGAARARIETFSLMDVVIVRPDLLLSAVDLHQLRQLSFWDALIVRSAAVGGCTRLLTEDLQHGQLLEGVRIENPFRADR